MKCEFHSLLDHNYWGVNSVGGLFNSHVCHSLAGSGLLCGFHIASCQVATPGTPRVLITKLGFSFLPPAYNFSQVNSNLNVSSPGNVSEDR